MGPADGQQVRDALLAATVATCSNKCGTDAWRGHLCEYHDGYRDGLDRMALALTDGHTEAPEHTR